MIQNLSISSFRGIPKRLDIDFTDVNGKAQSVLLLGDNGTGKSSVADAVEFCLRSKVSRRGNAGAKTRYEAKNLLTNRAPSVKVSLSGGREFLRGAAPKDFKGVRLGREDIVPGFTLAPVVVSRADIEVFWNVNQTDRMRFFFDYLRDSTNHPGYAALEIERTEARVEAAKVGLLEAQIALATVTGRPVSEIPIDERAEFYQWRSHAYPEYGQSISRPYGSRDPVVRRALSKIPPPIRAAVSHLQGQIEDIHKLKKHIASLRAQLELGDQVPSVIASELPTLLDEISEQVSRDFVAIARLPHIKGVLISSTSNGYELNVTCELTSGITVEPPQVLSEGALDILALLILLGVSQACARRGQSRFLVLDDVWQSVDNIYRNAILQYMFSQRFQKWQLLILVHDRLWARLIEDSARKHGFPLKTLELVAWTPEYGPRLRPGTLDTTAELAEIIGNKSREMICSFTSRVLEELADALSISLATSVTRTEGDRYTLESTWPGVHKTLKKSGLDSRIVEAAEGVHNNYALRNLYGVHPNSWAQSLTETEAIEFARFVVALSESVRCSTCGTVVSKLPREAGSKFGWPCGHVTDAEPPTPTS